MFLLRMLICLCLFCLTSTASAALTTLLPGTLRVGTYFTNPPLEFLHNNKRVGFEIDLMQAIAKKLGLSVEFVSSHWETLIADIVKNKFDVIMGGITITNERAKTIAFSEPYMVTVISIMVDKTNKPLITHVEQLKQQTIGLQAVTTDYDVAVKMQKRGEIAHIKIYPFANFDAALRDLMEGKIAAVLKIFPVAHYYEQRYPELKIIASVPNDPQPLGFGFNKKSNELVAAVNKAQAELKADGTYRKIYLKWFKK